MEDPGIGGGSLVGSVNSRYRIAPLLEVDELQ